MVVRPYVRTARKQYGDYIAFEQPGGEFCTFDLDPLSLSTPTMSQSSDKPGVAKIEFHCLRFFFLCSSASLVP